MPIRWPEPVRLVMFEAMACGTPVIAFERGSVPEIVEDGLTGLNVGDESEAIRCLVPRCDGASLTRQAEDALWQAFFTAAPERRRVCEYLDVYRGLIVGRAVPVLRRRHSVPRPGMGRPGDLARPHMAAQHGPASGPPLQQHAAVISPADLAAP